MSAAAFADRAAPEATRRPARRASRPTRRDRRRRSTSRDPTLRSPRSASAFFRAGGIVVAPARSTAVSSPRTRSGMLAMSESTPIRSRRANQPIQQTGAESVDFAESLHIDFQTAARRFVNDSCDQRLKHLHVGGRPRPRHADVQPLATHGALQRRSEAQVTPVVQAKASSDSASGTTALTRINDDVPSSGRRRPLAPVR